MIELDRKEAKALVESVKLAEEIKPSQHAKREVLRRYGLLGTDSDRLITAIFYDLMKRQGVIDKMIERFLRVPSVLILDPWLRAALRVAFEIMKFKKPNERTEEVLKWSVADLISEKSHPYVGMFYWKKFDQIKVFEYKPRNLYERLELKYLLPVWFIKRMKDFLGDEAEELFKSLNRKPLISIRVNTLKASVEEIVKHLQEVGKNPIISKVIPTVIKFKGPYDFEGSEPYRLGKFVVQEEAAALASIILSPQPGEFVIDMCAAPGGKTIHMAELMKLRGEIHAFDVDELRIKRMKELLERTGTGRIVKIYKEDARRVAEILGEEVADKVMLDAPCSSTGTIMKNPELRWRIKEDGLDDLVKLQRELIASAVKAVKKGGKILYTTCSLLPEEGEKNVEWALKNFPLRLIELKGPYSPSPLLKGTMRAWPHKHNTIGFFYALMEKT